MSNPARPYSPQVNSADAPPGRFRTLQYQPTAGEQWYHILFGHVPRYQMDFILRPELPSRKFRPQHFAHLGPLIKFLAPSSGMHYGVAIGNLSSNDTQHVPGRGGLSVCVTTRVAELRDHAQRESPVFAHGLVIVDEPLDPDKFAVSVETFAERVLTDGLAFYRAYYSSGQADHFDRVFGYVRSLRDLPSPCGLVEEEPIIVEERPPFNQIIVDCRGVDFRMVLRLASKLGVMLYRSSVKWTTITTGSEEFESRVHKGEDHSVAIRLICAGADIGDSECAVFNAARVLFCRYDELPSHPKELGTKLFGFPADREMIGGEAIHSRLPNPTDFDDFIDATELMQSIDLPAADLVRKLPLPGVAVGALASGSVPESVRPPTVPSPRRDHRAVLCSLAAVGGMLLGVGGCYGWLWLQRSTLIPNPLPGMVSEGPKNTEQRVERGLIERSSQGAMAADKVNAALADEDDPGHTQRLLVDQLRRATEPHQTHADEVANRAHQLQENSDSPSVRKIVQQVVEFQRQLKQMNKVADELVAPQQSGSVDKLLAQHCKVREEEESLNRKIKEFHFEREFSLSARAGAKSR